MQQNLASGWLRERWALLGTGRKYWDTSGLDQAKAGLVHIISTGFGGLLAAKWNALEYGLLAAGVLARICSEGGWAGSLVFPPIL